MSSKSIDGQLWYMEDFRYIATALRLDPTGIERYAEKATVRHFEKRKEADKWLKCDKSHGVLTKLNVCVVYYRPIW